MGYFDHIKADTTLTSKQKKAAFMSQLRENKIAVYPSLNCTPFVRQYDILSKKWGVLLCQKEYQTNDIRRNSKNW